MMRVVLCLLALASCGGAHAAGAQESSWPLHAVRRSLLTGSGGALSLNATVLPTTGSWVSVGWDFSGNSSFRASVLDVVALYVPATANWSTTAPVKFLNATGLTTGSLRCVPHRARGPAGPAAASQPLRRLPSKRLLTPLPASGY